uniref:Thioredoxin domain-containing protein n=2 Tax=Emiliania huxleyi TaxID=2903 RepID=A0A7S3RPT7_EMIHU
MKRKAEEKMEWQRNGHGRMAIVGDQKEFFSYTKSSARVVCLFTRESNRHGKILTEHLSMLAQRHLEARFICVDAEKAPFITEKLNIWMLPTIVCLKDNKVHKQHNGLDEIDSSGKYSSGMVEYLLHLDEMLDEAPLYERELQEEEEELADLDD